MAIFYCQGGAIYASGLKNSTILLGSRVKYLFCVLRAVDMAQISKSALVMFSATEMFDLVNDVRAYPEFLPGCSGSAILAQSENAMRASVNVAKAGIRKTFTTENTLVPGERIIMQLVDGPFKHLSGGWTFTALDDRACKVALDLEFEFSNKLVEMAFGRVFQDLCHAMVKAFSERAKEVYRV